MKAHICGVRAPLLLLYGMSADATDNIFLTVANHLAIAARTVGADALDETVGMLTDGAQRAADAFASAPFGDKEGADDLPAATPLLLMANFPDALVNTLLDTLRTQHAAPILKAIVTKHNQVWTLRTLLQELLREKQEREGKS